MSVRGTRAGWLIAASSLMVVQAVGGSAETGERRLTETAPDELLSAQPVTASGVVVTNGRGSGSVDGDCASVPTRLDVDEELTAEAADERRYRPAVKSPGALVVNVPAVSSIVARDSSSSQLEVTLCRRAWAPNKSEAIALLEGISLKQDAGRLEVAGPENSEPSVWAANLILEVPEGLVLDLYADRGSISLRGTTREVRAFSRSGGIYAALSGGTVALETEHGSIALRLADVAPWIGKGVMAFSRNGSVRAHLPSSSPFDSISATSRFGTVRADSESLRREIQSHSQPAAETNAPRLALATVNGPVLLTSGVGGTGTSDRDKP